MRALFVSDLHAHNHEAFATTLPNGRNSRFQNILNVLGEIRTLCLHHHVDTVFFLGDMFHSRTKVDVDVFGATWSAWREIAAIVDRVYILVGNHDQYNKVGNVHSLEAFGQFARIIDQPMIDRVEGVTFAAHPFTTNMQQWNGFVDLLPDGLDFFLFHQGICEAATGAFNISIKAEVSYADLPIQKARWCLGGHYHKPQEIGEEGKVAYVGSPLQHGFGERGETKSVILYQRGKLERITLASAPRFVYYERATAFWDDVAARSADPAAPWNRGDFIRVRTNQQKSVDKILKHFPDIEIEHQPGPIFEERRVETDVVSSDRTLLAEYIQQNANGLDHERLLSFGLEMLARSEDE